VAGKNRDGRSVDDEFDDDDRRESSGHAEPEVDDDAYDDEDAVDDEYDEELDDRDDDLEEEADDGEPSRSRSRSVAARTRPRTRVDRGRRTGPVSRLTRFLREIVAELQKVIWPTRKELLTYTLVVVVFVSILMTVVSLLDLGFAKVMFLVFGTNTDE
jgi:preprotein translocase subunit SecE